MLLKGICKLHRNHIPLQHLLINCSSKRIMATKVLSESPHGLPRPDKITEDKTDELRNVTRNLIASFSPTIKEHDKQEFKSHRNTSPPRKFQKIDHERTNTSSILKGISDKSQKKPFVVSVEGNIGSGKSTFLKYFSSLPNVETYQEPLDQWTNLEGHNLLGNLYKDPKRWSFLFQSYVQLTRLNIHLQHPDCDVKLIERSLHNNRYCFVELGHDKGLINDVEFNVLGEYFDFLNNNLAIGVDLIVYLRSTPEIVYERVKRRGRAEEEGVPLDYLQSVHNYYEKWLMEKKPFAPPAPVLIINADEELSQLMSDYESNKLMILGKDPLQDKEAKPSNKSPKDV